MYKELRGVIKKYTRKDHQESREDHEKSEEGQEELKNRISKLIENEIPLTNYLSSRKT